MKIFRYTWVIAGLLLAATACKKQVYDDLSFLETAAEPASLSAVFNITQDNTGMVTITPNGEGATRYQVYFGDATGSPAEVRPGTSVQHKYAEGVYTLKIRGYGIDGKMTETTRQITVSFKAPENVEVSVAIDPANKFKVNVSAKALYETVFRVFWGDVQNEVPQTFLEGETLSHTYARTGNYSVRVQALSGGAASTEVVRTVAIVDPVVLPITFESATIDYSFVNFDGGMVTVVNNPQKNGINTSDKVARMIKNPGQPWGGSLISLGNPIDFSANKIVRMKVWSPRVGAKVLFKVENATSGSIAFEKEVATTLANTWEDLAFDFRTINTSNSYQNIVLIFDLGTPGDGSANFTFYFDDIRLTNTLPGLQQIDLPVTFDEPNVNYAVTDFGNASTVNGVDPQNAANKVKVTTKPNGAEVWAGTTIGTPSGFANKIPFAAGATKMNMRVWAPAAGIKVRLKAEDHTNNTRSVETDAVTTVANGWETLVFDFSNHVAGTSPINLSTSYTMASVFFDFGVAGNGKVFYWDDVKFGAPAADAVVLPLSFESATANYAFTNFKRRQCLCSQQS